MEERIKKSEENFDDFNEIEHLFNDICQKETGYKSSIEFLRKEIEEEKKKNMEFEILVRSSKSALKDKENELNKIWNMLEEAKNEISIHKAKIQEKENAVEVLQKVNKKLETELQNALNSARQEGEGYQDKIELLKKEIAEKSRLLDELNMNSKTIAQTIEEKESAVKELKKNLQEKTNELSSRNEEISLLMDRIEKNSEGNLGLIIREKNNFIRRLEENLSVLKKESEENKNRYVRAVEEKRNKEQELGFAVIERDKEIEDLKNQIACLKKESAELTEKWTFSSVQLQNASSNLRARNGEIEILEGKIKTLEKECENYKQQSMSLKTHEILNSMSVADKQKENEKLQALTEALRQEGDKYNNLLSRHENLVLQVKNLETEKARLVANSERLSRDNANLRQELERLAQREQELLRLYEEKTYRLSSETAGSSGKTEEVLKKVIEEKENIIKELEEKNISLKKTEQERGAIYLNYVNESRNKEAELNSLIMEKEEELIDLRNQLRCIKKELGDITEKWTFSSAQLQTTSSNLRTKESEVEILEGRIKTLEKECESYRRMSLKTQEVINSLSDYKEKQENEKILALTNAISHESAKYGELLGHFETINSQLKLLEDEKVKIKISHDVLLKENEHLRKQYISIESSKNEEIEKLNEQISLIEKDFNKKLGDVVKRERMRHLEIAREKQDSGIMLKRKEAELEHVKDSLKTLQKEYDALVQHEKEINEKYSKEITVEISALKEITGNVELKDNQIKNLIDIIDSNKKEIEKQKQEYKLLSNERDRILAHSRTRNKKDLTGAERRLKETEDNLKKKEAELNKIKVQLDKLKAEKSMWVEKENKFKENLTTKKHGSLIMDARNKLKEKEKEILLLNIKLENLNKESNNLKKQQEEMQKNLKSYPSDLQELVAGISHQISNSISIIKSHAEFCMEAPHDANFKNSMNAIIRSTIQLQKKIENISNFISPVILQCKPLMVKDLMAEVIKSVNIKYNIEKVNIEVLEDKNLKPIKADWVRMQEAFYQVVLNAIESMPESGKLKIELKRDHALENQIIRISDTGSGIEKKHLTSVFEPFFTTKSEKIGLGLSIAKNIIKAHSGNIRITSEFGKGTVVEITLPMS